MKSMETLPVVAIHRVMMESASSGIYKPENSSANMDFQSEIGNEPLSMEMGDSTEQHIDIDPLDLES